MAKVYQFSCRECNNDQNFSRYSKDSDGYQKYLCRECKHQFAPERPRLISAEGTRSGQIDGRKYPSCPVCGKASFLRHDNEHYSNYRCGDKRCNHSFFSWKAAAISAPSMTTRFGKGDFQRMRYPVHQITSALRMSYLGKSSFRNISLILSTA